MRLFSIKTKLLFVFSFLIVTLLLASVMGIVSLNRMNSRLNHVIDNSAEKIKLAARINQNVVAISRAEKDFILATTQEEMEIYSAYIEQILTDIQDRRKILRKLMDSAGKELLDKFSETWNQYMTINRAIRSIAKKNSNVRAQLLSQGEARKSYEKAAETMLKIVNIDENASQQFSSAKNIQKLLDFTERIKLATIINRDLMEIQREEKNFILAKADSEMDEYALEIKKARIDLVQKLTRLEGLARIASRPLLFRFHAEFDAYIRLHDQVIELSRENSNARAFLISSGKARQLNDRARRQISAIVEKNEQDLELEKTTSDLHYSQVQWILIMLTISSALCGIGIAVYIGMSISRAVIKSLEVANAVANGDLSIEVDEVKNRDESGMLLVALNEVRQSLKNISEQANAITHGDYTTNILPRSAKDVLGTAMLKMTIALREAVEKNDRADWLKTGLNLLDAEMRGELTSKQMAERIINFLSKYLGAQVGAFYGADDDKEYLTFLYGYAFTKTSAFKEMVKISEGIIGQVAHDKKMIILKNLPNDYMQISSSSGEVNPYIVVVIPFIFETNLGGVIELGSYKEFSTIEMEFLSSAMESIAVSFTSARSNEKLKALLERTQIQSDELEKQSDLLEFQSEELRQSNDELQKQTELLEARKTELELSGKYKSEFLANISHELRNPLNSMLVLSQGLLKNKEGNLSRKQIESINIITKGGNDLLHLINDLLDLSKIEAGKVYIECRKVKLNNIVSSISDSFREMAESKGLEWVVNIATDLPETIITDHHRVEQILRNFISNAIKFTEKGSITVTLDNPPKETVFYKNDLNAESCIMFSIKDSGIGIPFKKQKIIFDAFQQADGSTSRKYGGTGLGLSISKELASLLGGEIQLLSKVEVEQSEKGSTFSLFLPLEAPPYLLHPETEQQESKEKIEETFSPATEETKPVLGKKAKKTHVFDDRLNINEAEDKIILIMEDDPEFSTALRDICQSRNLKVIISPYGETGIQLAHYYSLAGIILDMQLPDIDGWTVLGKLKESSATSHIPVHIFSVDEPNIDAFGLGVIGFLSKPVSVDQMKNSIDKLIDFSDKKQKDLLVIESSNERRDSVIRLIENVDIKISEATTAKKALTLLKSNIFDCVILNLTLIDMSGLDLLSKVEENNEITIPPIIVYTGRELTQEEYMIILQYRKSLVIKNVQSEERFLDEVTLFLHQEISKLSSATQEKIERIRSSDSILTDKKVLLVDDDMKGSYALSEELRDFGMKTFIADEGKMALEVLSKESDIDLVLMDIMMPGMDGYETMRHIRDIEKFSKLPIIAITAKAMPEDRIKCIDAGADDFIIKPVNCNRLISKIRAWLT